MKDMRKKIFRFLFAISIVIFSITSCEVGMGSAVDTIPPDLEIKSPESASIIRDTFAIKGTWSDDRGVQGVYLQEQTIIQFIQKALAFITTIQ